MWHETRTGNRASEIGTETNSRGRPTDQHPHLGLHVMKQNTCRKTLRFPNRKTWMLCRWLAWAHLPPCWRSLQLLLVLVLQPASILGSINYLCFWNYPHGSGPILGSRIQEPGHLSRYPLGSNPPLIHTL